MHAFAAAQHTCSSRVHVLTNNKIRVRVTCTVYLYSPATGIAVLRVAYDATLVPRAITGHPLAQELAVEATDTRRACPNFRIPDLACAIRYRGFGYHLICPL